MKHVFSNPDDYSRNSNLQYEFAHSMLKEAGLKINDSVLDLGCGDGKISADISKMVTKGLVVGADISLSMISYATLQYVPSSHKNLGFIVMDAETNIFSSQFDIVVSFCCLHWIGDQLSALKGINKALKTNGTAILLVPLRHYELYTAIDTTVLNEKWKNYFKNFKNPHQFFSLEQYKRLLITANLLPSIFSEEIMEYTFNTKKMMENFLAAWLPHINVIPKEQKSEFLDDIGNEFLNLAPKTTKEEVKIPLRMLKIHAKPNKKTKINIE